MYYINATPNEAGNYGNPQTHPADGKIALPDALLSTYISTMGFAELTISDSTVTAVSCNDDAYQEYADTHAETDEPDEPTEEDDINAMLIDHEYRLTLIELGVE